MPSVLDSIPGVGGYEEGRTADNVAALARARTAEGVLNAQRMMSELRQRQSVLDAVGRSNGDYDAMSRNLAGVGDLAGAEHARRLGNEEAISRELPNALNPDQSIDYGKMASILGRRGNPSAALIAAERAEKRKDVKTATDRNRQSVLSMAGSPGVEPTTPNDDEGNPMPVAQGQPSVLQPYLDHADPNVRAQAQVIQGVMRSDPNLTSEQLTKHFESLANLTKAYTEGQANRQNKIDMRSMVEEGMDRRAAEKLTKAMDEPANVRTMKFAAKALVESGRANPETGKAFTPEEAMSEVVASHLKLDKGRITPGVVAQVYNTVRRTADDPKTVPDEMKAAMDLVRQIAGSANGPKPATSDKPPVTGAKLAPDGKWYVRQGSKWAEVVVGK